MAGAYVADSQQRPAKRRAAARKPMTAHEGCVTSKILNTGFGRRFGEILGSSSIKDAPRLKIKGGGRNLFRHALRPDLKRFGRFAF